MVELLTRYREKLPPCVIHCFTGTKEHALTYLNLGCYIGLTGYLWKDKSENGVRKILQDNVIPLDRLLVETDAPFMYPNTRASKLPQNVKDAMTERLAVVEINDVNHFVMNEVGFGVKCSFHLIPDLTCFYNDIALFKEMSHAACQ